MRFWKNFETVIAHAKSAVQYMRNSSKGPIRETVKNELSRKIITNELSNPMRNVKNPDYQKIKRERYIL